MFGLLRLLLFLAVGLTVVYWCLMFWFRAGEKDRLLAEWRRDRPPLPEHTFVANGLRDHRGRMRRRLIWGVYAVPMAAVCLVVWLINYA